MRRVPGAAAVVSYTVQRCAPMLTLHPTEISMTRISLIALSLSFLLGAGAMPAGAQPAPAAAPAAMPAGAPAAMPTPPPDGAPGAASLLDAFPRDLQGWRGRCVRRACDSQC